MGKITGLSVDREGLKKKNTCTGGHPHFILVSSQRQHHPPTPEKINATPNKSTPIARVAWVV